jgi:hypothetical protein
MGRRDRLVWLLSVSWGDIGWKLPKAKNREQLYEALVPLHGHPGEDVIAIFVRPTSASATAQEIRKVGKALGKSVVRMHAAQQEQRAFADLLREAETAIKMNQVEDADTDLKLTHVWTQNVGMQWLVSSSSVKQSLGPLTVPSRKAAI